MVLERVILLYIICFMMSFLDKDFAMVACLFFVGSSREYFTCLVAGRLAEVKLMNIQCMMIVSR